MTIEKARLNLSYNVTKSYDKHKNDLILKTNKLIIIDSTALCIKTRIVKLKRSLDLSCGFGVSHRLGVSHRFTVKTYLSPKRTPTESQNVPPVEKSKRTCTSIFPYNINILLDIIHKINSFTIHKLCLLDSFFFHSR